MVNPCYAGGKYTLTLDTQLPPVAKKHLYMQPLTRVLGELRCFCSHRKVEYPRMHWADSTGCQSITDTHTDKYLNEMFFWGLWEEPGGTRPDENRKLNPGLETL